MKTLDTWLGEYSRDHQNPWNKLVHKICVPMIFLSIIGGLHLIPFAVAGIPAGDWISGLAILSYGRWGFMASAVMLVQWLIALSLAVGIQDFAHENTIWVLSGIFVTAWIGQFAGHSIEGQRPSFLTDLQYLLIGPLWIWLGH